MSQLDEGSRALGGMERREKHRRRERHGYVGLQSLSTSTLGCHHSAQPSPAQSIQAVSRETRTRHILVFDVNCTPVIWASLSPAGFCLPQLFYYDSFAMIGLLHIADVRLMAKGAILNCSEEKKPLGTAWKKRLQPLRFNSLRRWILGEKKLVCFAEFLFRACFLAEIPDFVLSYFCINCLCAGSRNAHFLCFSTHLDTAELVIVERCL